MNEFKQELIKQIKQNRKNLSDNSIKTYISSLTSINKKMDGEKTLEWYDKNAKNIIEFLDKGNSNSKTSKTVLSSIFVLTGNKEIHDKMISLSNEVNEQYKSNKKTQKQEQNWITSDKIKDIYQDYYNKTLKIIKQRIINKYDTELIVKYLLLAFLSGSLFPPRRSLDFALLKIKNYDEDVDNYYKKGVCYFNNYKTKNVYGKQSILLPKPLDDIIKKWSKINPTDFMLFSSNGQPLTSSQITKILNDIFNMNVSTSMLRHIFLSDKYTNVEEQMKQDALKMGHNSLTQSQYIVK
jgi:site-specific recombinase XerD